MKMNPVTVAETQLFLRQAEGVWSEQERFEFVDFIAANPEVGDLIPETGGVRKVRWKRQGSGKRGGVRVIYFYYNEEIPLYLLMIYSKAVKEDLTADQKRAVVDFTSQLKRRAKNERA